MNILLERYKIDYWTWGERYKTFTFPAILSGSWDNNAGGGSLQYTITIIQLHEDIDGEGWINAVQYNNLEDVQANNGYSVEIRGVNVRIDVRVEYTLNTTYGQETWTKMYYNCMSKVSRANLNYSNIKKDAILRADYGKGEPLVFNLFFDKGQITDLSSINYNYYSVTNQWTDLWDPQTITASKNWTTKETEIITHDLKKEIVINEGVSNGYIGLNDIAKKAQSFYIGYNNKAKKIKTIYIGDKDGKARKFYSESGGVIDLPYGIFFSYYDDDYPEEGIVSINGIFSNQYNAWWERYPSSTSIPIIYGYFPSKSKGKTVMINNPIS